MTERSGKRTRLDPVGPCTVKRVSREPGRPVLLGDLSAPKSPTASRAECTRPLLLPPWDWFARFSEGPMCTGLATWASATATPARDAATALERVDVGAVKGACSQTAGFPEPGGTSRTGRNREQRRPWPGDPRTRAWGRSWSTGPGTRHDLLRPGTTRMAAGAQSQESRGQLGRGSFQISADLSAHGPGVKKCDFTASCLARARVTRTGP